MKLSMGNFRVGEGMTAFPGIEVYPIVLEAPPYEGVELASDANCEILHELSMDTVTRESVDTLEGTKDVLMPRGSLVSGDWASKFPLEDLWFNPMMSGTPLFGCAINGNFHQQPDPEGDWVDPRVFPEALRVEKLRLPFSVAVEVDKVNDFSVHQTGLESAWDIIHDRLRLQEGMDLDDPTFSETMAGILDREKPNFDAFLRKFAGARGFVITVSGTIAHLEILPNQSISNEWFPVLLETAFIEQRYNNLCSVDEDERRNTPGDSHADIVDFVTSTFAALEQNAVVQSDWGGARGDHYMKPTDKPLPWAVELSTEAIFARGKALLWPGKEVLMPGHIEVSKRRQWPQT